MRRICQKENPEEERGKEMSEVNDPSRNVSLIQSMLQRLSEAEHKDPCHNPRPSTPPYRHRTASGEPGAALALQAEVVAVIDEDDKRDDVWQLVVPTETHGDMKSPDVDSEERDEGGSGVVLETPLVEEDTSAPTALIPRWERKVFKPCPYVLDTRPTPPPVSPKKPFLPIPPVLDTRPPPPPVSPKKPFLPRPPVLNTRTPPPPKSRKESFLHSSPVQDTRTPTPPKSPNTRILPSLPVLNTGPSPPVRHKKEAKPPLHLTGTPPPTLPKPINRCQIRPTWEEVVGEGPGCELRPVGPGSQKQDVLLSHSSEEVQKMLPTGSVVEQDLFEPRGMVLGSPPKASKPEETGLMEEPKPLSKPPSRNKLSSPGPEVRSKASRNGSSSSGPETRDISPDLQPVPLPRLRFLTPIVDKKNSGVDSVFSDRDKDQINMEGGGVLQLVRNEGGAEEVGVQDTVLSTKPPMMKIKADKVTKSARKMIDRWKENLRKERGKEGIHGDDVEKEEASKMQSANLHQGQNSVRLPAQMRDIEEDDKDEEDYNEEDKNKEDLEREDQEVEEFSSVTCMQQSPISEQLSRAQPIRRHGSFLSSFKFNFSEVSLMDEILTGEEWAPFLSGNSDPSSSPSIDQSKVTSQHGFGDNSQIENESELGSPHNVKQNLMDTDFSEYEEVIINLSDKSVENQSDAGQDEVKKCNNNGVKAIIESEVLMDYGEAGRSKLDQSRTKSSNESNDSAEPIRNQPFDLSCVKLHDVLDSSAQKHRIELSKKRKHRVPKLKGFFRIGRTNIRAPDIQLIKQSSPSGSSTCPTASSPPCDIFPTSVFYSIPPSVDNQDPVGSPTQGSLPVKISDVHSSVVNMNSPRSKVITALRNKAKRKPL